MGSTQLNFQARVSSVYPYRSCLDSFSISKLWCSAVSIVYKGSQPVHQLLIQTRRSISITNSAEPLGSRECCW